MREGDVESAADSSGGCASDADVPKMHMYLVPRRARIQGRLLQHSTRGPRAIKKKKMHMYLVPRRARIQSS